MKSTTFFQKARIFVAALCLILCVPFAANAATPGVPQNLKLTPGDGMITATWEAPDDDGGSPITGYAVQCVYNDFIDEPFEAEIPLAAGVLTYTWNGLENNRTYTIYVWAVNGDGQSWSIFGSCTPNPFIRSVTPDDQAPVSGEVLILFGFDMDKTVHGTVKLDDGSGSPITLTGGKWNNDRVYSIPYAGLAFGTTYMVIISGFTDLSGEDMETDNSYSFTTVAGYLYVLGVPVNDANKDDIKGEGISGKLSYDPGAKTLTLENATAFLNEEDLLEIMEDPEENIMKLYTIYSFDDLTIKLIGDNQLGKLLGDPENEENYTALIGILGASVTLTGPGNLTIYDAIAGVLAEDIRVNIDGVLTIEEYGALFGAGCCLNAVNTVIIEKGSLNLTSHNSIGILGSEGVFINGGDISVRSRSVGIFGGWEDIVINGGNITVLSQGVPFYEEEGDSNEMPDMFAFYPAPVFGAAYNYTVFAGDDEASAIEIANPTDETFTESKYVQIKATGSGIEQLRITKQRSALANYELRVAGYYNLMGQKLPQKPQSGIYIIKYDNGTAKKQLIINN